MSVMTLQARRGVERKVFDLRCSLDDRRRAVRSSQSSQTVDPSLGILFQIIFRSTEHAALLVVGGRGRGSKTEGRRRGNKTYI